MRTSCLHLYARNRIVRKLIALGLFCDGGPIWFDQYAFSSVNGYRLPICFVTALLLEKEFTRNTLSLLKIVARSDPVTGVSHLGINYFESRVKTLPLQRLLIEYVWLANEMLIADAFLDEGRV